MRKVVFRVDASVFIGSGHVMRCLTLADALRQRNIESVFLCKQYEGNMISFIRLKGYDVECLPGETHDGEFSQKDDAALTGKWLRKQHRKIDWLVVDQYKLDLEWEREIRQYTNGLLVIDDLANRQHECNILLDQNYYCNMFLRYEGYVPKECLQLLGPQYCLLREEFAISRKNMQWRSRVERIFVFFGGGDATGETLKALQAIDILENKNMLVDVVIGMSNPRKETIRQLCLRRGFNYHCQVDNMSQLMVQADIAIGAGGSVTWERCYLGLPAIVTVVAENQKHLAECVARTDAIINLGWANDVTPQHFVEALRRLILHPEKVTEMSKAAVMLMGESEVWGADKVINAMERIYADL